MVEEEVASLVGGYRQPRIVVVIAHELEYLGSYDRVVFVADGRVVETGTHAELRDGCEAYCDALRLVPEEVS